MRMTLILFFLLQYASIAEAWVSPNSFHRRSRENMRLWANDNTRNSEKTQFLSPSLRRRIYETLAPLDRGDFRWEMLVPW